MASSIFDNPVVTYGLIIVVVGIVIGMLFKKNKKSFPEFKEFESQDFSTTIINELKKKIDNQGLKFRGRLYIGFKDICRIDKYFIGKGKFALSVYDPKKKEFKVQPTEKDTQYEILFIRAKSTNILYRLFGMKKNYYLLQYKNIADLTSVKFDVANKRIFLPPNMDLTSYGNVWTNTTDGIEYVNNISMKRMNEEIMMLIENMPDRVVHLETEQAKKERISKIVTDLEKGRWEERKDAGDTTIS